MKNKLILSALLLCVFSCNLNFKKNSNQSGFLLFIPDTTNNWRANDELLYMNNYRKIESQMGLKDLMIGAENLEIRLWYSGSFSPSEELYVLKFQDSFCFFTQNKVFYTYDDYYANPILDSFTSKSVRLKSNIFNDSLIDSIWRLKSQSVLLSSFKGGFTDCDNYTIEIADKKRFKFIHHHCPMGYYKKLKLPDIQKFMDIFYCLTYYARKYELVDK